MTPLQPSIVGRSSTRDFRTELRAFNRSASETSIWLESFLALAIQCERQKDKHFEHEGLHLLPSDDATCPWELGNAGLRFGSGYAIRYRTFHYCAWGCEMILPESFIVALDLSRDVYRACTI
jgi:hypothetical protein